MGPKESNQIKQTNKDKNGGTPVWLEPAAPWSWVKHSTTEPLAPYDLFVNFEKAAKFEIVVCCNL